MRFLYALLILLLPVSIFAQSNYRPGYVIQSNGDTLKGYINYREWDLCPKSIEYKNLTSDKQATEFTPQTSKEVHVNGLETYITYAGPLSIGATNLQDLRDHIDTAKKNVLVYLKVAVTGKHLTLYSYKDELKTWFLIAEPNTAPIELRYYRYFSDYNNVVNVDIYKGQLQLRIGKFMPVTDNLSKQINEANYEFRDLEPLINKVNGEAIAARTKSVLRPFVGLAANSIKTTVNNVGKINSQQSYTGITPKINIGLDILGNSVVQKFIFRTELSYAYTKPNYHYSADPGFGIPSTTVVDYKFNQSIVSLSPQAIFNIYNTSKVKLYLDAGVLFNVSFYSNQLLHTVNTSIYNTVITYSKADPYKPSGFSTGFLLQAGARLSDRVEIHFAFTAAPNVSFDSTVQELNPITLNTQTMDFGIKYLF
ncbi:hypothetical protein [Mucilaginibacter sp.]|uniref:hypothetical protein n=1 Tax=Mucilaginibacter sp. TaxID=1882438 RepID=UPI0025E69B5C|nr:hypothetical protein [Mucilaginibacter sp.]